MCRPSQNERNKLELIEISRIPPMAPSGLVGLWYPHWNLTVKQESRFSSLLGTIKSGVFPKRA